MKRKLLLTVLAIDLLNFCFAQNPLVKQWDYRFGGTDMEWLSCFKQTKDKGFILGGMSYSGIGGDKTQAVWDTSIWSRGDYWVIKIDSLGNKQWDKDFGGLKEDQLNSIYQTSDGGYILGGTSASGIGGDKTQNIWDICATCLYKYDYWVIKIDSLGNKEWDKDFGGFSIDALSDVQQTTDGGYILGGVSQSGIGGSKSQPLKGLADFWIIKIDSLGNKQWDKDFGGSGGQGIEALKQTADGGYILAGNSGSGISGDKTQPNWDTTENSYDYWILKTDSSGNKQWDKRYGGTNHEYLISLDQTIDGSYILGGSSLSDSSGDKTQNNWDPTNTTYDFWIIKIDSLGNKQWDKTLGGIATEDEYGDAKKTLDGGCIISGTSYSNIGGDKTENNLGAEQAWIIKTDSLSNKLWDKTIFTSGHDEHALAIEIENRCFVIAIQTNGGIGGYKTQPSQGSDDYWIIKFCDTTSTTSINQISNFQLSFSIYPNPTNTILNLFVNSKENIVITNLLGEIVLQKTAEGKVELDVSSLSTGIYFIKVGNEMRKFVKD